MPAAKRLMAAAREQNNPCIKCGSVGSTCGRHYNGIRQHIYGKGRGIKGHPFVVADLCARCDAEFQEGSIAKIDWQGRVEYSEEFQHLCLLTLIRRFEQGAIEVRGGP